MSEQKYDQGTVEAIIARLAKRFGQDGGLHAKVKYRRAHYHGLPEADPPVPSGWEHCKMQSSIARDVGTEMRSRLIENEWMPQAVALAGTGRETALIGCAAATFVLRAGSVALGWRLPVYRPRPPRDGLR